jgi:hypothetical protein
MATVLRRLSVVGPGLAIGVLLSLTAGLPVVLNPRVWDQPHPPPVWSALLVCLGPVAGPFAEPLARVDYSVGHMCLWGVPLLVLIGLHPCRPNVLTGCLSGLSLACWFLLGFANTYAAV